MVKTSTRLLSDLTQLMSRKPHHLRLFRLVIAVVAECSEEERQSALGKVKEAGHDDDTLHDLYRRLRQHAEVAKDCVAQLMTCCESCEVLATRARTLGIAVMGKELMPSQIDDRVGEYIREIASLRDTLSYTSVINQILKRVRAE